MGSPSRRSSRRRGLTLHHRIRSPTSARPCPWSTFRQPCRPASEHDRGRPSRGPRRRRHQRAALRRDPRPTFRAPSSAGEPPRRVARRPRRRAPTTTRPPRVDAAAENGDGRAPAERADGHDRPPSRRRRRRPRPRPPTRPAPVTTETTPAPPVTPSTEARRRRPAPAPPARPARSVPPVPPRSSAGHAARALAAAAASLRWAGPVRGCAPAYAEPLVAPTWPARAVSRA